MRVIDLHAYPATEPWITAQGPYVEALSKYWRREWKAKAEDEVLAEFRAAGVQVAMVAFDIETAAGTPPCSNEYVASFRAKAPEKVVEGLRRRNAELAILIQRMRDTLDGLPPE